LTPLSTIDGSNSGVTPDQFAVELIAVDDQFVYWAEEVFGAIKQAPK
jgi:hypothetical protein